MQTKYIAHKRFGSVPVDSDYFESTPLEHNNMLIRVVISGTNLVLQDLENFASFLTSIDASVKIVREYFEANFYEVVGFAFESWFESEPEFMAELFTKAKNISDVTPSETWKLLMATRVALNKDANEITLVIDFEFVGEVTNYLVAAEFTKDFKLSMVSLES